MKKENQHLPINQKSLLTIPEAAEYSNIGQNKISEMLKNPRCTFVLYVGRKKLIKRELFDAFLMKSVEI
jgi:excisionase family DNA binding protein